MPADEVVVEALARLRKGRGLLADDLDARVGPRFRLLCGAPTDSGAALRAKVLAYLEELLAGLSEGQRLVVRAALNLHPPAEHRYVQGRIDWLARHLGVDERTARRRMDEAFAAMGRNAASGTGTTSGAGHGGDGWYVEHFDAVVRLDVPVPEAIERRTIVVTAPELDSIVTSTDVPPHPDAPAATRGLATELVFGGSLRTNGRASASNFTSVIALPRTLRRGERHDYCVIARIPPGQPMAPHYVCVPLRKYRHFTLLVRFPLDRLPRRVWSLAGVTHRVIDERTPTDDLLVPDRAGEVRAEFHDLLPGCGYGIQWEH